MVFVISDCIMKWQSSIFIYMKNISPMEKEGAAYVSTKAL